MSKEEAAGVRPGGSYGIMVPSRDYKLASGAYEKVALMDGHLEGSLDHVEYLLCMRVGMSQG